MNDNQETQDVDGPRPGDNFAEIKIGMKEAKKKALKDVISQLVDQAYAQDAVARRHYTKSFRETAAEKRRTANQRPSVSHQIMPVIAAGRVGSMIAKLPPVILKEKSKK